MIMPNPPYGLWSIWSNLSLLQHLFFLILFAVSIYSLWSATMTVVRLLSIEKLERNEDLISIHRSVVALHNRCANVRQVIGASFYLFGLVFFLGLQSAPRTLGHSTAPVGMQIFENFVTHFAFAANVFLVFLILHLVHWFECSRLNSSPVASQRLVARSKIAP
jgi:hypothetical protein